ncbi:MAG: 2-hydroxyacid dehydrogenase [Rhodospirillaceae bacterium]
MNPKRTILQIARLSPEAEHALTDRYTVHLAASEADQRAYAVLHGPSVDAIVTTAMVGARADLIEALPNVRVIASRGVGYDTIDLACARSRGIAVSYTPDLLTDCVADLAFGALVAAARNICAADRFVRRGDWMHGRFPMSTRVSGKRLGILGLGAIGRAIAKRASGFDLEIRYHNRRPVAGIAYRYEPSLVELARWADFLVVSCSGGPGTRGIVSSEVIAALGSKGYLVNVSRGSVVDEPALVEALVGKRIAGAALDVYEREPHVPEALLPLDNVVLLPHISSSSRETFAAMEALVLENLRSFFERGELKTPVPDAEAA